MSWIEFRRIQGALLGVSLFLVLTFASTFPGILSGQVVASERQTLKQVISGTEIEIDYARPSARGRIPVFGELVGWMEEEAWTPGANQATTLRFSKDVTLNGIDVPAGKYSLWVQVKEMGPWDFLLLEDTTLFHVPHRHPDEAFRSIPVEPREIEVFTETLTFQIDSIRAMGGILNLEWGRTRVPVTLGVDPGMTLVVASEVADRYTGTWMIDYGPGAPTDSTIAAWRANLSEDQIPGFEAFLERDRKRRSEPTPVELRHHPEEGYLEVVDATQPMGPRSTQVLLLEAEGIFTTGTLIEGELAYAAGMGDSQYWEFVFDEDGRAVGLTVRNPDDSIEGIGERPGG